METQTQIPHTYKNGNPASHSLPPHASSTIFLGSHVNPNQHYPPTYNSFFKNYSTSSLGHANPSFMFRERKEKVNWRNIANLNIDEVVRKGDLSKLESLLSNITFANLEKEDLEKFGDETLLKLFKLSQYGLEHLLNNQNYLAHQTVALHNQYRSAEEQIRPLQEQAKLDYEEIVDLKGRIKHKKNLLAAYHNHLSQPIFKCHLCFKYFKSQEYLDSHFERRHGVEFQSNTQKERSGPQKIVLKDTATSPTLPDRNENNNFQETMRRNSEKVRYGSQASSSMENNNRLQTEAEDLMLIEKLVNQYKQQEELKFSQLNITIQERMEEVLRENRELTEKLGKLEKKMETQSSPSLKKTKINNNRELASSVKKGPKIPEEEPAMDKISLLQKKVYEDVEHNKTSSTNDQLDQTVNYKSLDTAATERNLSLNEFQNMKTVKKANTKGDKEADIQKALIGAALAALPWVNSSNYLSKTEQKQLFKSGDLEDTIEGIRQQFKAGSLADLDDDRDELSKSTLGGSIQVLKSRHLEDLDEVKKQLFKSQDMEDKNNDQKQMLKLEQSQLDKQRSKDRGLKKSGDLEDDQDSIIFKKSTKLNTDDIIMERHDEDDSEKNTPELRKTEETTSQGGRREKEIKQSQEMALNTNQDMNDSEIAEDRQGLIIKAHNAMKNKYKYPVARDQYEQIKTDVEKDLNTVCKQVYNVEYSKLADKDISELEKIAAHIKKLNSTLNNHAFAKMENEYKNARKKTVESMRKPNNNAKSNQEGSRNDTKASKSGDALDVLMKQGTQGSINSHELKHQSGSMGNLKIVGVLGSTDRQSL